MINYFEDCILDTGRRELRRGGALVPLQPQVFDLLEYLIQHRHRVVSRNDLLEVIWQGRIVSDAALDTRLSAARQAVGDSGSRQRLIRTMRTKGFRFIGSVRQEPLSNKTACVAEGSDNRPLLEDYPTVAVLPLLNIGGDQQQAVLADGITEDLMVALSRVDWIHVASCNACFACKGQFLQNAHVAHKLGVRYLLTGSIRFVAGRIRLTVHLVDAIIDRQIWTERYDLDMTGDFTSQDSICERVIAALEPHLYIAEHVRIQHRGTADLNEWECIVRALSLMNTRDEQNVAMAITLLNKAILINPHSARSRSLRSIASTMRVHMSWADRQNVIPAALASAHQALSLNPDDPWSHAALAYATIWKEPEEALKACERAISLNPNLAVAHYYFALGATYAGYASDYALAHAEKVESLAKRDLLMRCYVGAHDNVRATACFAMERYREGIKFARNAVTYSPNSPTTYRALTINLALGGDLDGAREALRSLKRLAPKISHDWIKKNAVWASKRTGKQFVEAFVSAGLCGPTAG